MNEIEKKPLYLANYGFDPTKVPIEIEADKVDFIDNRLREWVRLKNSSSWAYERLRILAEMLEEERPREWVQSQVQEIREKLKTPN